MNIKTTNAQIKQLAKNKQPINTKAFDDDDDEVVQGSLGYFVKQVSSTVVTVHIDEAVKTPSYYRRVVQAISDLGENDQVIFKINSPGGLVNGLVHVLTSLESTSAVSVAQIYGEAISAASMLALMCDVVYVGDNATMMVHFISHGASGKADDVYRQVMHIRQSNENLFRKVYKGFLSEEEIESCLKGTEYWFDSKEILDRLKKRDELREQDELQEIESVHDKTTEENTSELPTISTPISDLIEFPDEYILDNLDNSDITESEERRFALTQR